MNLLVLNSFEYFAFRWLFSTNHKDIGTLYFILGALSGVIGTALSVYMRFELSRPGLQFMVDNISLWNVFITLHAFISFVFILYIPLSCYIEDLPNVKKIDHICIANFFILFFFKDLQEFVFHYERAC